jgi:Origin of replication binding protein
MSFSLTLDDIESLAAGLPEVPFEPENPIIARKALSKNELQALYTIQTYNESNIVAHDGVIAWHSEKKYFRHFETHQNFIDFILGSDPATCYWSEKIYGTQPQKLRIDYDSKGERADPEIISDTLRTLFRELYGQYLLPCEVITCDMSDATKQSLHIIIDGYYVTSNIEAKYFAEKLKARLGDKGAAIDLQPYSKSAGLRAVLNSKCVDGAPARTKMPPPRVELINTLITYVHLCQPLQKIVPVQEKIQAHINLTGDKLVEYVKAIPAQYTTGFEFRKIIGSFIHFTRTEPMKCLLSDEVHHRDNTLYGVVVTGGIKLKCRHCTGCVVVPCEVKVKVIKPRRNSDGKSKRIIAICGKHVTENELKANNVYKYTGDKNQHGDMMNELPSGDAPDAKIPGTVFVRAQMGVGKTSALRRFIDRTPPKSILAVSFRVSFTAGMCQKFDLTSYKMINGMINVVNNPRVMVQCESLHKINPAPAPYDMLILDEVQSILQQMFSHGTHRHIMRSWAILEHMIKSARIVVCMDAHIDQSTIDLITQIRGGSSVLHINNAVPRMSRHKIIEKKSSAVAMIMSLLEQGQHVVVPSASCSLAEKIFAMAKKAYPQKSIKIYTSKTPDDVKARDFADVNTSWAGHDLLIFTPTVLAGLSYTRCDYHVAVCLWNDTSVDIFGSLQMMGRVRDIASGIYYHYISERGAELPETSDDLLQYIEESYENFVREDGPEYDIVGFYADGRVKINDSARFRAWLGVQARLNYSRNNFLEAFVRELKLTGGEVSLHVEDEDLARGKLVNVQLRQIGDEISVATAEAAAVARELSADDYDEVISQDHNITDEDHAAIEKYNFRRFYKYDREITPGLLLKYGKLRLKCQYIRRKRLRVENGGPEEGLRSIVNGVIAAGNVTGVRVEHIKSVFDVNRDKYAFLLMKIFGPPFDTTYVLTRAQLIEKLKLYQELLTRECTKICGVFGVRSVALPKIGDDDYVKRMLDFINGKLDAQYGVKIKATDNNRNNYKLVDPFAELFDQALNIK